MDPPRNSSGPDQPAFGESCARGTIVMAFCDAANVLWGEAGIRAIGVVLPENMRRETVDVGVVNLAWVPETYVLAWYEAVWHGPCRGDRDAFVGFLQRMMDRGFGRVRKAFMSLAKPAVILSKAPSLWRHDHTHGELTVETVGRDSARVKLVDHAYTTTSLACLATAESYRYGVELCQAKNVTEIHYREGNALNVRIHWQP